MDDDTWSDTPVDTVGVHLFDATEGRARHARDSEVSRCTATVSLASHLSETGSLVDNRPMSDDANTVPANWAVKCDHIPSRVPGLPQTVLTDSASVRSFSRSTPSLR